MPTTPALPADARRYSATPTGSHSAATPRCFCTSSTHESTAASSTTTTTSAAAQSIRSSCTGSANRWRKACPRKVCWAMMPAVTYCATSFPTAEASTRCGRVRSAASRAHSALSAIPAEASTIPACTLSASRPTAASAPAHYETRLNHSDSSNALLRRHGRDALQAAHIHGRTCGRGHEPRFLLAFRETEMEHGHSRHHHLPLRRREAIRRNRRIRMGAPRLERELRNSTFRLRTLHNLPYLADTHPHILRQPAVQDVCKSGAIGICHDRLGNKCQLRLHQPRKCPRLSTQPTDRAARRENHRHVRLRHKRRHRL